MIPFIGSGAKVPLLLKGIFHTKLLSELGYVAWGIGISMTEDRLWSI